jgi:hypothetical protein
VRLFGKPLHTFPDALWEAALPLPQPHPGLVIGYSYLWRAEHLRGEEEGRKDRPCAIIAVRQIVEDKVLVMVFPVTHTAPKNGDDSVEIPLALKKHLGLDDARSWVAVSGSESIHLARHCFQVDPSRHSQLPNSEASHFRDHFLLEPVVTTGSTMPEARQESQSHDRDPCRR